VTVDCPLQPEFGSSAYMNKVFDHACKSRLPVFGAIDLTYRCNLRCVHCYAGHLVAQPKPRANELSTEEVVRLLTEAADAGCMFMLLTGGEPLLRDDFLDIYQAGKRLGLIVSVFTNGTLVDESHAEVFRDLPPHVVEVSVYGASEQTSARVTGRPGTHARVRRGVELLLEAGVPVILKTMILRDNLHEVHSIEQWARDLGVRFRMDPVVTPRLDGDLGPLEQRVDPETAVEVELADTTRRAELGLYLEGQRARNVEATLPPTRIYRCGAGLASFHLDPAGYIHPCLMSRTIAYNTAALGFFRGWKAVTEAVDGATWEGRGGCAECQDFLVCGYCPGLFELEGASPANPPEYLCRLGASRKSVVASGRHEVTGVR